jgi:EmrB/QacA subfamily drug resistance transporter
MRRRQALAAVCMVMAQMSIVLVLTMTAVALPQIQRSLMFSDAAKQWVLTAYTLPFATLLLLGGRVTRLIGLRRSFLIATAGFALASVLCGISTSFDMLVVARVLQGVCAALQSPSNLSLINVVFKGKRQRATMFGVLSVAGGVGGGVGMVIGGVLTDLGNWRWCFFIVAIVVTAAFSLSLHAFRGVTAGHGDRGERLATDLGGLLLGCVGVFGIVYGFSEASRTSWTSTSTLTFLAGGGSLIVLFAVREHYAARPILPLAMFASRQRSSSYLVLLLVGWIQMGSSVYMTYYFQNHLGFTPMVAGFAFLPQVAGIILVGPVAARTLAPRLGIRVLYPAGALLEAAGFLFLGRLTTTSVYSSGVLPAQIIIGIGLGLLMAPAFAAGTTGVDRAHIGIASALVNMCQQLGSSLGAAFLTTYATRYATSYLSAHTPEIRRQATANLTAQQLKPASQAGHGLIHQIIAAWETTARVLSYAAGFRLTGIISAAVAVLLVVVLCSGWHSRCHCCRRGPRPHTGRSDRRR